MYYEFNENVFKDSVSKALQSVQRILDVDRSPNVRFAEDVDHHYEDKYKLANALTNTTIAALLTVLSLLGLTKDVLQSIDSSKAAVTLRLSSSRSCTFVKEEVVDEPLPFTKESQEDTTVTTELGTSESSTRKSTIERIVKRVTKRHYNIGMDWELSIYSGTDVDNRKVIRQRKGISSPLTTSRLHNHGKVHPPFPPKTEYPHKELSLTWLLQQIDTEELKSHFAIDTSPENVNTKTPSQNLQIEQAMQFLNSVSEWACDVNYWFGKHWFGRLQRHVKNPITDEEIFVPVIPLLVAQEANGGQIRSESESGAEGEEANKELVESKAAISLPPSDTLISHSVMLSVADTTKFLNEHARTLSETHQKVQKELPDPESPFSSVEAMMYVLCCHIQKLSKQWKASIQYIEGMLRKQLVAAIGKEVFKRDLDKFVTYHNDKLFNPSPKRFCYTIRRPEHYPDGILSIEESYLDGSTTVESISTHVREVNSVDPIKVPLNAATTLALTGKTYLHGWLNHRFQTTNDSFRLNARARQFSSFVLLVGTMTDQNHMQPKDAIILRNKDEIHIPLLLNEIPTATEFKNSIGSLSPEQQRFAKSFRSMQLDSSVLGVCVIQIKPQLEKLLGLPKDSLTKEMKLAEDLMELFIEYQVPSDLVSCDSGVLTDGDDEGKSDHKYAKHKVANVREHVKSVMDVIATQKEEQLEEQRKRKQMKKMKGQQVAQNRSPGLNYSLYAGAPPKPRMLSMSLDGGAEECEEAYYEEQEDDENYDSYASNEISHDATENHVEDAKLSKTKEEMGIFAAMPKVLNRAIELYDKDTALRSTTIETVESGWTRFRQENLLSGTKKESLGSDEIASEKSRALDLLDALSRSGSLEIPFSELHVLICATHRFDKNVMESVIQDNINPIEKLEMSTLLMASTILGIPSRDLIRDENDRKRLEKSFPLLLVSSSSFDDQTSIKVDDAQTADDQIADADDSTIAADS